MIKILIIDDSDITIKYLKEFIRNIQGHDYHFSQANNYDSARLFLSDSFDIVLCDNKLGDDKFGIDIVQDYTGLWPESFCLLYSADYALMNKNYAKKIKCHSLAEVEVELIALLENINVVPILSEAMEMQLNSTIPVSGYSKELCNIRHDQNEKEHSSIIDSQKTFVSEMKEIRKDMSTSLEKVADKFDESLNKVVKKFEDNNNQGKAIFKAMVFLIIGSFLLPVVLRYLPAPAVHSQSAPIVTTQK